jgi:hypothetical protein
MGLLSDPSNGVLNSKSRFALAPDFSGWMSLLEQASYA